MNHRKHAPRNTTAAAPVWGQPHTALPQRTKWSDRVRRVHDADGRPRLDVTSYAAFLQSDRTVLGQQLATHRHCLPPHLQFAVPSFEAK